MAQISVIKSQFYFYSACISVSVKLPFKNVIDHREYNDIKYYTLLFSSSVHWSLIYLL